ncbi:MAG: DUF882 domain-containing protein [Symploca sp. SIO2E9]|nr:DUF882 domain-containing protein [Symploca sp. SIO2E9]
MTQYTLTRLKPHYERLWATCQVRADLIDQIEEIASKVIELRPYYEKVGTEFPVPWWWVGCIHAQQNFALIDSFILEMLNKLKMLQFEKMPADLDIPTLLFAFDAWNGFRGIIDDISSLVWAGTNHLKIETTVPGLGAIAFYMYHAGLTQTDADAREHKPGEVKLVVRTTTTFKNSPIQSYKLQESEKITVNQGQVFSIVEDDPYEDGAHVRVVLADDSLGGSKVWFCYLQHIEIQGCPSDNKPQDEPEILPEPSQRNRGKLIAIPGESDVHLFDPILGDNCHFNWAEATKGGTRLPENQKVVDNIKKITEGLEEIRELFGGKSITITSFYRPPHINRQVGGARNSRHIQGDAVDFVIKGIPPKEAHRRLEPWWGNRGGIASASVFTHVDCRGYKARWSYGY